MEKGQSCRWSWWTAIPSAEYKSEKKVKSWSLTSCWEISNLSLLHFPKKAIYKMPYCKCVTESIAKHHGPGTSVQRTVKKAVFMPINQMVGRGRWNTDSAKPHSHRSSKNSCAAPKPGAALTDATTICIQLHTLCYRYFVGISMMLRVGSTWKCTTKCISIYSI